MLSGDWPCSTTVGVVFEKNCSVKKLPAMLHSKFLICLVAVCSVLTCQSRSRGDRYRSASGAVATTTCLNFGVDHCVGDGINDIWDCQACDCSARRDLSFGPLTIHRNPHTHSAKCRFGLGCIDEEFISPRQWKLWHVCRPWSIEHVCEHDERLLDDCFYQPAWRVAGDIYSDYRNFHSRSGLALLGLGIGMHAILANTSLDQQFRDSFQDHAVGDPNALEIGRHLGEIWVTIPLVVATWSLGECLEQESDEGRRRVGQRLNAWGAKPVARCLLGQRRRECFKC